MKKIVMVLLASFAVASMAHAGVIILQSGQRIEGQILERNDMDVVIDVLGRVETFYLGEIATIDGQAVELPPAPAPQKQAAVPDFGDEQASLARFMDKRGAAKASAVHPAPAVPAPKAAATVKISMPKAVPAIHPSSAATPTVIPTADGGIIVVGPDKITKYDKDLRIIKEAPLDNAAAKTK
ncbi:MAG: hypothetical protein KGK03_01880 [Candidatus Omnitrophica bacterium]|nr:hypothetical protein [Candidatus Omnitrophota bacterium]